LKTSTFVTGLVLALTPLGAHAEDFPLLGRWQLQTYAREAPDGQRTEPFGPTPDGYINYSSDGRMYAILMRSDRAKPTSGAAATEAEAARLHNTMVAYGGTYEIVKDGEVIHHVDISWNEGLTDTDQVRYYVLKDDVLTITTPEMGGAPYVLVWKKVK